MFFDVDGTLLEFADDPAAVIVSPPLLALLHALHHALDGALALVSGRELSDLDRLFNHPSWAAAGMHGLELRHADGTRRRIDVAAAEQVHMRDAARTLAARFDGVQVEDKGVAIALHCRRVPGQLPALRAAAQLLSAQLGGYEMQAGNLVVEFKPTGIDKGHAVMELLQREPFINRQPVYLGDDLTDEHAFARVNAAHGISVRIGSREPTRAQFTLTDPMAVEAWLRRVLATLTTTAMTSGSSVDV